MRSSKLALATLLTTMLMLTLFIRSFVTDELTVIENSVQVFQEENVKQLSRVVETQEKVNKVPWLIARFIASDQAEKRNYLQAQIMRQIALVDQEYMGHSDYPEDERALHEYVRRNWAGYKETVLEIIHSSPNTGKTQDQMEDSLLYLERVNDGMKMIVAYHERDVAQKTAGTLNRTMQARQNVLVLVVLASVTFILVGMAVFRKIITAEKKLSIQAYYDTLTGLPNRLSFQKSVRDELSLAAAATSGAVVFLDMDNFKLVNDQYGHEAGDQFLIVIAQRIRSLFNEQVFGARFGGDEFVLYIRNAGEQEADLVLQQLRMRIAEPVQLEGKMIFPTTSIGVAFYPQHGTNVVELLKHADTAMYQAKEKGNGYVVYDESATK